MVTNYSPTGLIATTRADIAPPLDDLVSCSGWPLLVEASPRRLARELSLHDPQCLLFWLDDERAIAPTARLVEWSRQRGARPYRVAVAFELAPEAEAVFRAAGAHTFLPISGRSAADVTETLRSLLAAAVCTPVIAKARARPGPTSRSGVAAMESPIDLVRPP